MDPSWRELARGLHLPEGPVALADGCVLVVEVLGGCLTKIRRDGTKQLLAKTGGGPNGAAIGPDGQCYVCNNGGIPLVEREGRWSTDANQDAWQPGYIQCVDLQSGACETLYTHSREGHLGAPNDLVFDDAGGFWFTDHGRNWPHIREKGAIYYANADGSHIERVLSDVENPNGIGLSPDGRELYVAETYTGHIWSFEVVAPGKLSRTESFMSTGGRLIGRAPAGMFIDSLAVDARGYICVGTLGVGGIWSLSPDGRSSEHLPLPDKLVTNLCFGGPQRRTAFVTLSHSGRLIALDWPYPGLRLNYGN